MIGFANGVILAKAGVSTERRYWESIRMVEYFEPETIEPLIRTFATGATRNLDAAKLDYEGFLSPTAVHAFAEYMHGKRLQADGTMRSGDNWQAGIPLDSYMKSMFRHMMDVWMLHRGITPTQPETGEPVDFKEALCGLLFNVQGYLHETLKKTLEFQE